MTNAAEEPSVEEFGDFLVLLAENGLADEVGSWVSDQVGNRPSPASSCSPCWTPTTWRPPLRRQVCR